MGLTKYFVFYNTERPHSKLGNQTPATVHKNGKGNGALIVNKYPKETQGNARKRKETQDQKSRILNENAQALDAIV